MDPDPPAHHRLHASHAQWLREVGSTRGTGPYRGVRDVDVVAACSLLARWEAGDADPWLVLPELAPRAGEAGG